MKPTVGRIVHYASTKERTVCWAAMITGVNSDGSCDLAVFPRRVDGEAFWDPLTATPAGDQAFAPLLARMSCREGKAAGDWHWPERVE